MNNTKKDEGAAFYNELITGPVKSFLPKKVKTKQVVLNVKIQPEQARYILKNYNINNRKPSKVVATKYATDLKNGNWQDTGDTIRFDSDGNMMDGQHRLLGCIMADIPINTDIVYGLDPAVFPNIDNGKIKTAADIGKMLGYEDSAILMALTRSVMSYENSGTHDAKKSFDGVNQLTKQQLFDYLEANPTLTEYVDKYKKSPVVSSAISTFCHWLLSTVDKKKAEAYLDMVFMGFGLQPDTIEAYLFNKFQRNKNAPQNKMTKSAIIANVILGWRRYTGLSQSKAMQITWDSAKGLPSPN